MGCAHASHLSRGLHVSDVSIAVAALGLDSAYYNNASAVACPNGCSGHGRCVALNDLHLESNAAPFGPNDFEYGGDAGELSWIEDKAYACVCDSDWAVGYAPGESQATSWYGFDCSMRKCIL